MYKLLWVIIPNLPRPLSYRSSPVWAQELNENMFIYMIKHLVTSHSGIIITITPLTKLFIVFIEICYLLQIGNVHSEWLCASYRNYTLYRWPSVHHFTITMANKISRILVVLKGINHHNFDEHQWLYRLWCTGVSFILCSGVCMPEGTYILWVGVLISLDISIYVYTLIYSNFALGSSLD